MRGGGGADGGATGRAALGTAGEALAETPEGAPATGTGTAGGGVGGRTGALTDVEEAGDDTAGGTTTRTGTTGVAGGAATGAVGDATIGFAGGGVTIAGLSAGGCKAGVAAGRGAAAGATASLRCVIAFSTSPGREMLDRSILVLISSSPRSARELDLLAVDEPSAEERR
jgi:hypothetical protein